MKRHHSLTLGLASLAVLAAAAPAAAQPVTLEIVHAWGGHARFHTPIAEAFMAQHPDIKIVYRAPLPSYTEGHQAILRQAVSDDLPDIWYSPYNLLGELVATLEPRGQITPLDALLSGEGEAFVSANYDPAVLALGQVAGTQWGVPFNASTPIAYYNLDLIKAAGGNSDALPTDWDSLIALGKAISESSDDSDGFAYSAAEWSDDWLWQALIDNYGGTMMNVDKTEVTFGNEAGVQALAVLARMAAETEMPILNEDQTIEQFAAGKLGIFIGSTAEVRVMGDLVGGKFAWQTGPYPVVDQTNGGIPVGGNVATILTADPARQAAAWEFIKFATGPEGQKIAVLGSGYMPTNLLATAPEYLGEHYAQNPDWATSLKQWPVAKAWFGYPGGKGTRIWHEQQLILGGVMRGDVTPEDALPALVEVTERLLAE
jgi:multiple sugar transport system substrate-binding protein